MIKIYGIKNCDTMKKAFKWMEAHDVDYEFHDYKKQGVDIEALKNAIKVHGWENVINKRGTTWRKLDEGIKNAMNADKAIEIAQDNPSIIKRPIITHNDKIILGFDQDAYQVKFIQ